MGLTDERNGGAFAYDGCPLQDAICMTRLPCESRQKLCGGSPVHVFPGSLVTAVNAFTSVVAVETSYDFRLIGFILATCDPAANVASLLSRCTAVVPASTTCRVAGTQVPQQQPTRLQASFAFVPSQLEYSTFHVLLHFNALEKSNACGSPQGGNT